MICMFGPFFFSPSHLCAHFNVGSSNFLDRPSQLLPPNLGTVVRLGVCLCVHKGVQRPWVPPSGGPLPSLFPLQSSPMGMDRTGDATILY